MRRIIFTVTSLTVSLLLAAPTSASSPPESLSGFVPDFTKAIPFLSEGQSATVGSVTVTATTNTGISGGANTYLHQSNARLQTILTFSPPIPGFQVKTRNHADCETTVDAGPDCFEKYTFTGKNETDQIIFSAEINNSNETTSYIPGADSVGYLTELVSTLQIDYTYDTGKTGTGVGETNRGSFLEMLLTDTSLAPATQSVRGNLGTSIDATPAYTTKGFAGAITYAVTSGTLPDGLVLDTTTGVISGTPTSTSPGFVTITATGASFGRATATVTFVLSSPPTTAAPTTTTAAPTTSTATPTTEPVIVTAQKSGPKKTLLPSTGAENSPLVLSTLLLAIGSMIVAVRRRLLA
jgi:LPXTG-motif cell wall-anchored protein